MWKLLYRARLVQVMNDEKEYVCPDTNVLRKVEILSYRQKTSKLIHIPLLQIKLNH